MQQVDILFPINQQIPYSYLLDTISTESLIGRRVVAPLRNRPLVGLIVNQKVAVTKVLKHIIELVDDSEFFPKELIDILFFTSNYYANSAGDTLKFFIPNKTTPKLDRQITLSENLDWDDIKRVVGKSSVKYEIIQLLKQHKLLSYNKLQRLIGKTISQQINELSKVSAVSASYNLKDAEIKEQMVQFLHPVADIDSSSIRQNAHSQQLALKQLSLITSPIELNLFRQIHNISLSTIKSLQKKELIHLEGRVVERKANHYATAYKQNFQLSKEQEAISNRIKKSELTFKTHLLFGITGSGKTFIYIDVLKHVFNTGKNAIILIPEIALTAQTVTRFKSVFGDSIAVLHSRMSDGERYDAWRLLRDGRYRIAIGPRSAILAPLSNIGLIVVDEEHDWSYKQSEQIPRYNARDLAIYRAKQSNCPIILGSATPSVESYQHALNNKYSLHELKTRPVHIQSPEIEIVDLKEELKVRPSKENVMLTQVLATAIERCLLMKEQIILFQNKRGYSSYLHCIDCGKINDCPNCSISLVYHKVDKSLVCHFCGYKQKLIQKCGACDSANLSISGFGTQRIEELIHHNFPHARVLRMDSDTTRKKNAHQLILQKFESGEADILVGTQMISKGLDFPNVTLVGVLNADLGLSIPDFRSAERSYQLISQVAGRSGRGDKKGHVIIQTFQPDHYSIQAAQSNKFDQFFDIESKQRESIFYPPFSRLINIRISAENQDNVFESISLFSEQLKRIIGSDMDLLGPVPCPIERINKMYRWQLLLKIKQKIDSSHFELKLQLLNLKEFIRRKNTKIRIAIDVDPYDLL